MRGLYGKTALVTNDSSGIGQAIATHLGHEDVNVAINYIGVREVNECSQPSRAVVVEADVSDEAAVDLPLRKV